MNTLLDRARRGENLADLDIVDMHGHFGHYTMPIADMTPEGLVRVMDRIGVASVLVSHMQCVSMHAQLGNDEVLAAMRVCPGRILGYVVVFPSSLADATTEMQRCVAAGFTGLKLHNASGFAYTDPRYAGALSIANERRMPVLLHTWGEERDAAAVRDLAPKYPDAAFLLAHSGAGNAGTGFAALTREFPNVYLELAYSMGPRGLVEKLVAQAGVDRVIWGSDCYFFSMTQQVGKVLGADLSDEDKRKILSGNARRLLARVAAGQ